MIVSVLSVECVERKGKPTVDIAKNLIPTYTIISRHSANCPDKPKGKTSLRCGCKKWVRVYDPRIADPKKRQTRFLDQNGLERKSPFPTKTRSASEAEKIRQSLEDCHDPDKQRAAVAETKLQVLQAEKESKAATIEKAVAMFLVYKRDNPSRRSSRLSGKTAETTMSSYLALLGDVDPISFKVKRKGHLFTWLERQTPELILISDLTPVLMDAFRATWNFPSDLTAAKSFTRLKTFFAYCKERGQWIKDNPLDGVARPTVQEGSRTAAFSDEQYKAILDTLADREKSIRAGNPEAEFETKKQLADNKRLLAIVELMRWGGLALYDAVDFRFAALNHDELRYRRRKTNRWAKPVLPTHVVDLLRTVIPPSGGDQPFRDLAMKIGSNKGYWSRQIKNLFVDAGIETVETEIRKRNTHAHMLRDTFAVGQLERHIRDGKPSLKSIADALGDSVPVMLKHYAPVIDKLEKAHAEEQRKVVAAQVAELRKRESKPNVIVLEGRK